MSPLNFITEQQIQEFQENGAICLRQVFSSYWIDIISKGIEKNLSNPSQFSESLKTKDCKGSYFNDYCNWKSISEFKDYAFKSPAGAIAGALMESQYAVFYHEHVLIKEPGSFKTTPWHQDQPYYPIEGFKNCSIWMPLEPVAQEICVQFVKGSHRWGKYFFPRKFATTLNYQLEKSNMFGQIFENVPDIDNNLDKYEILKWDVQPGDCIVFHMKTLHSAPSNASLTTSRRVLSTRWLGDDTILAERPWTPSPPNLGGLKFGEKVISEDFPMVWKATQ